MNKRIIVAEDKQSIKLATHEIDNMVGVINLCLKACETITGDRKLISLDAIEKHIAELSGFSSNIKASADLLGFKANYIYLVNNLHLIDLSIAEYDKKEKQYKAKKEVLDAIKEEHTAYLSESNQESYYKLLELTRLIQEVGIHNYRCIDITFDGTPVVNVGRLNNIGQRGI
jgi:hypothetical protein